MAIAPGITRGKLCGSTRDAMRTKMALLYLVLY